MFKKGLKTYTGAVLQTTDGAGDILVGMAFKGRPVYPTGLEVVPDTEFTRSDLWELKDLINTEGLKLAEERGMTYEPFFQICP
jgi:hypothetical protein